MNLRILKSHSIPEREKDLNLAVSRSHMIEHRTKKRVRYGETDKMGYLYYGHYASLYEIGRTEMIRDLVMPYADLENKYGLMMPVLKLECRYLRPALYDDHLTILTRLPELPGKLIYFDHEIYNQKEELLNTGKTTLFFVDMKTNKRVSTPSYILDPLKESF